jgi:hypothetical protein
MIHLMKSHLSWLALLLIVVNGCRSPDPSNHVQSHQMTDEKRIDNKTDNAISKTSKQALAKRILEDSDLQSVLKKGQNLLRTGLNAGSGYGEVWIRDLNTFIELALETGPKNAIREGLLTFFKFQELDGNVSDGFILRKSVSVGYKFRE